MSFFFAKTAKKAPVKRQAAPTKANAEVLFRLGCKACPLNTAPITTPKMGPTLAPQTEVLFLAEAPGRDEDENTGQPLTGPSGKLLRSCIPERWRDSCSFDNVCNCRPEANRTPVWTEIECCRPRRHAVIEQIKPKIIVGLGAVPLSWMLGSTDISNLRGRLFTVKVGNHVCRFLPTYHPAFILRGGGHGGRPLNSRFGHCFRMDVRRVFDDLDTTPLVQCVLQNTDQEIRAETACFDGSEPTKLLTLLKAARQAPLKAIDIETSCLRPYSPKARILTIAISFGDTNFSFAWNHPQGKRPTNEVVSAVRDLLKDNTIKVAHNAPFELEWFAEEFGREIINHMAWECTMMQAHFLDERKGGNREDDNTGANRYLGLDFLCKLHFGISYKSHFKLNKKDMANSDLGEMLVYNAVDTKYTLKLYHHQKQLLKKRGLLAAYEEAAPRQPTVALMQHLGIPVDQAEVNRLQQKFETEIKRTDNEIRSQPVVHTFSQDHHGNYNPLSGPDTLEIFKDYLKRKEVYVEGGKNIGRYSVDKHVLDKIDHPLAKLIVELRQHSKMKSTYVDGLKLGEGKYIYPDGKLHTSFHTTGTDTGRLSSSDPNMQNFPMRAGADTRRQIVPPPGHVLVAVDYKQLEGSTTAMCSKDEYYVKALKSNYDTHMVWAKRLAELVPNCTDRVDGRFRSMVKNKLVFPSFFGASVESVTAYLSNGCGIDMPQDKIQGLMDEFWDTFRGVKRWQNQLMKQYYETGYVATLSGRRRHYPLNRNEAINHPVQGTAAELVCDAMVRLSYEAIRTDIWYLHPILNIHDDLTFICLDTPNVLDTTIAFIVKEMLTFDFPWINVPLACEVSIGRNWCDMESIGEFWSHQI